MRLNSRILIVVGLLLALCLSAWLQPVGASSLAETRITQLEFKVRSLQTQLNQLQGQSPPPTSNISTRRATPNPPLDELSLDDQFDNLATLVIEINQRVKRLEAEISTSMP